MRRFALILGVLGGCGEDGGGPGTPDAALIIDAATPDAGDPDATPLPACMNNMDDDGDARIDYPFDPGCESQEDDDEFDVPPLPECADGVDNDGDDFIDYPGDPGCTSAADQDESNGFGGCGPSVVLEYLEVPSTVSGDLTIAPNELVSPTCGGTGGERVYVFNVEAPAAMLVISTDHEGTELDTVLYVREKCRAEATELGCDDDSGGSGNSILTLTDVPVGSYYLILDSFGPGSLGPYQLSIEVL